jgi:hypothetical protein
VNFRIEWSPPILKQFADDWDQLDRNKQRHVLDTLDEIDQLLIARPMEIGESRVSSTIRILVHPPVLIVFRVNLRLKLVTIIGARIVSNHK